MTGISALHTEPPLASACTKPLALPLDEIARGRHRDPRWRLVLRFRKTSDEERDHQLISQALPWLREVEDAAVVSGNLHDFGMAVIECDGEAITRRLLTDVRGWKVAASAFDPLGRAFLPGP